MLSCGNDDEGALESRDDFYSDALTTATNEDLIGVWAIFNVGFEGQIAEVPEIYPECGRDFFIYTDNGIYTEYLFQDSSCNFVINNLNWDLSNGIITLSNEFNQSDDLVITSLNDNFFAFKSRLDIDNDGTLDIISLLAQRYEPNEIDTVSNTFGETSDPEDDNLISYSWQPYTGFNEFDRYEIYRSSGDNCSKDNAILVTTIMDPNETRFVDLDPPSEQQLCYFLKVYTNEGLLGESLLNTFWTDIIFPTPVGFDEPIINGNSIAMSWDASEDPYFSHYEIAFSNYDGGTASGQQEYTVTSIDDKNLTEFTDENPPYLERPVYVLYVHNIFGNRTSFVNSEVTTFWELPYKREELLNFRFIESYAFDDESPVMYLYGRETDDEGKYNIHRYNYENQQLESVSNLTPSSSTSVPIKFFNTTSGKEVIIVQGVNLSVYNASNMEYKYDMSPGISGIDDLVFYNGYWVLLTNDDIYTFKRDNANLELIDTKAHFPDHQGSFNYRLFAINDNDLLVGHNNEANSYVYSLDSNGNLSEPQIVPIPIKDTWESDTQYNDAGKYLINFNENRLYSTESFSFLESFEQPYFPSGLSNDGTIILGSNNDPEWQINDDSIHSKEALLLNRGTQSLQIIETIGYPHIVFESPNGKLWSLSSGLKKQDIGQNINDKSDLFIEPLN